MAGDPFGLLLKQRIIFLGGEVRADVAWDYRAQCRGGMVLRSSRQGPCRRPCLLEARVRRPRRLTAMPLPPGIAGERLHGRRPHQPAAAARCAELGGGELELLSLTHRAALAAPAARACGRLAVRPTDPLLPALPGPSPLS